jgi:hypothetical protein
LQTWPGDDPRRLYLALSTSTGHALVEMPRADVEAFLRRTHSLIPPGTESRYMDLDIELALLIDGKPTT